MNCFLIFIENNRKIEDLYQTKLKRKIEEAYAHTRNLHVALYGRIKMTFFDAEAKINTLLILHFSHFIIYIFVQKNTIYQNIYKKINLPNMVLLSNLIKISL